MDITKELLKKEAQKIEERMGLRKFGNCPICDDRIESDGTCCYCSWNNKCSPEETAKQYNDYWVNGREDNDSYKRIPKKAEDFT